MSLTRRTFVQRLSASGLLAMGAMPPRFLCRAARAAEAGSPNTTGRVLVLVQLEGGNDGLNTVIPFGDDAYYRARPGLGVSRETVLKLDDYHGLHPSLTGFKELFDEGALSILQGVGYPNPDRSHFRSMDIWHSARPESVRIETGWLGRALDATAAQHEAKAPALALGMERLPLALVAAKINVPLITDLASYELRLAEGSEADRTAMRARLFQSTELPPGDAAELQFLTNTARSAYQSAEKLRAVMGSYQPAVEYPGNALAQQLKLIAQIVASESETRIFFVSLGGFDTHADQAAAHAALLTELSSACRAFYQDLAGHGLQDRVLLATFSEFGRRVKENGSLGTDHGAASQMFVISPGRAGLCGQHPSLVDLTDGDLQHHTDFRSVYATLLEKWLELPAEPVLGERFAMLDFV
jgi:uncharacterized protein (DUF1501 family)